MIRLHLVFLLTFSGWCAPSPSAFPVSSCYVVTQPAPLADLLQDALVACARAHSHLLSLQEAVTAAAFPEGLTYQEAEVMMVDQALIAFPAVPELRARDARERLQKALGWLERVRRAVDILWPEWLEEDAFRYLGRVDVNLRNIHCTLERFLLSSGPYQGPLDYEALMSAEEEASLRTESGSGRRVRDWLFFRHYSQFLLLLGHQLEALSSTTTQQRSFSSSSSSS